MKLTDDLTRGDWTRERFGPGWSVAGTVGSGFEAYARILHPVPASRVDLDVPRQLPYGMPTIVEETVWPWAELARRNGRSMHPLVQSRRLNDDESRMHFDDGWYCGQTRSGFLEPEYLADIVTRLTPETTTPGDLTVGVWEGWGELQAPASSTPPRETTGLLRLPTTRPSGQASLRRFARHWREPDTSRRDCSVVARSCHRFCSSCRIAGT
ncbi:MULTISPECIES: hypothetical protein [unclassified Frondihabitans]|uniref:hypothetical protein n=1 Tax=unclassified Frondihabitans TaxID=2626248 RepID=UPI000F511E32|nr:MULTISPECIES: hypothetical protein [unclassified Frondihabitans]RPE78533.1 hypothetical protein EDF37_1212 [Frondihabitans sp. PhB153]RPF08814.1 hypothetical protein EDF39_1214 [Frondihabitans sp. PhB161]